MYCLGMLNQRPEILQLPSISRTEFDSDFPIVSVITPNFNHAHYLEDTLIGVNRQTYRNLEHIVIDGGSSDNSVEILKRFSDVKWTSETDRGMWDGYFKGLKMSKGKYIVTCFSSDMYIDPEWIENCVKTLESNPTLSMVWGGVATANIEGEIVEKHSWPSSEKVIPDGIEMFFYWLATSVNLPETNYCVSRDLMMSLISESDIAENEFKSDQDIALLFQFRFHAGGYLAKYLPRTPNFVRVHHDQRTVAWNSTGLFATKMATYARWHKRYRSRLLLGKNQIFRSPSGQEIVKYRWPRVIFKYTSRKLGIILKGQI